MDNELVIVKKKCNKCGDPKPLGEFPKGRGAVCKICKKPQWKKKYDKRSQYYINHAKEYRQKNAETEKKKRRIRDEKNKERNKKANADYIEKNRARLNKIRRERNKNNLHSRIAQRIRQQIQRVIKKGDKKNKMSELMGCTMEFFTGYIAAKFLEGMSWDNYGYNTWHLDHIKPCYLFDLTDPEEQKKCFHYTNYQPLWKLDNLRKNKFYTEPTTETQP